jgi:type I restriction enzyme S subunit
MDTDELRIRRWGEVGNGYLGPAFNVRFRPGQVLYGSRRTYLRKIAVADFEGICANTTFVLESANPTVLLPELLPFVMQTEAFHEHSKRESKGSVNPYVNFSDLAPYEFALPPMSVQERISRRLSSIEANRDEAKNLQSALSEALDALAQWYATAGLRDVDARGVVERKRLPHDWRLLSIREICTGGEAGLTLGPFGSDLKIDDYGHLKKGTPVLFVADVGRFDLRHQSQRFISAAKHADLVSHEAIVGDVLVTEMGWPPGEACVVPAGWPPSIIKADIIRARVNPSKMAPAYLELVLNSHWGQQQIVRISPGTTRPRMTLRDFEQLLLAVPPLNEQQRAVQQADNIRARKADARRRLELLDALKAAALATSTSES